MSQVAGPPDEIAVATPLSRAFVIEELKAVPRDAYAWLMMPFSSLPILLLGVTITSGQLLSIITSWNDIHSKIWTTALVRLGVTPYNQRLPLILSYLTAACVVYTIGVRRNRVRLDLSGLRGLVHWSTWFWVAGFFPLLLLGGLGMVSEWSVRGWRVVAAAVHVAIAVVLYKWLGRRLDLFAPFERFGKGLLPSIAAILVVVAAVVIAELSDAWLTRIDEFLFGQERGNLLLSILVSPLFSLGFSFMLACFTYAMIFVIFVAVSFLRTFFGFLAAIVVIFLLDKAILPYLQDAWEWVRRS